MKIKTRFFLFDIKPLRHSDRRIIVNIPKRLVFKSFNRNRIKRWIKFLSRERSIGGLERPYIKLVHSLKDRFEVLGRQEYLDLRDNLR